MIAEVQRVCERWEHVNTNAEEGKEEEEDKDEKDEKEETVQKGRISEDLIFLNCSK